jgi:hypothetical protein
MDNPPGDPKSSILGLLLRIFNKTKPQPSPIRIVPPDNPIEPVRIVTARVLLAIYDPVMDPVSGVKLSQLMK